MFNWMRLFLSLLLVCPAVWAVNCEDFVLEQKDSPLLQLRKLVHQITPNTALFDPIVRVAGRLTPLNKVIDPSTMALIRRRDSLEDLAFTFDRLGPWNGPYASGAYGITEHWGVYTSNHGANYAGSHVVTVNSKSILFDVQFGEHLPSYISIMRDLRIATMSAYETLNAMAKDLDRTHPRIARKLHVDINDPDIQFWVHFKLGPQEGTPSGERLASTGHGVEVWQFKRDYISIYFNHRNLFQRTVFNLFADLLLDRSRSVEPLEALKTEPSKYRANGIDVNPKFPIINDIGEWFDKPHPQGLGHAYTWSFQLPFIEAKPLTPREEKIRQKRLRELGGHTIFDRQIGPG